MSSKNTLQLMSILTINGELSVSFPPECSPELSDFKIPTSFDPKLNEMNFTTYKGVNALDVILLLQTRYGEIVHEGKNILIDSIINNVEVIRNRCRTFKFALTLPDALPPQKNRMSDAGFDLHLVKKIKEKDGVSFWDTGVQVEPPIGYYFDLVGRSSISKTGFMLANNVGIIDAGYRGNIIVALVRLDGKEHNLDLPCKLVQLIPRKMNFMMGEQVEAFEETSRNDSGGLGSKNFKNEKVN